MRESPHFGHTLTQRKVHPKRTDQYMPSLQLTTNRLIHESSPYLLQHAHNPVDWYRWDDEAFAKAKERRQNDSAFLRLLGLPLVACL